MKRLIYLIGIIFATTFFIGCEKEDPQLLSEFVIGSWESQEIYLGDTPVYFTVDIDATSYYLSLTDGTQSIDLPAGDYMVDNDLNTITIDHPQFPGNEPNDDYISYDVTWLEGGNTMTWTPYDSPPDSDPPVLVWTLVE